VADRSNEGLTAWRQSQNHNHMIDLQEGGAGRGGHSVELAFFGSSAFRITTPAGLTIMFDPWRNAPWGNWDWYLYDFPPTEVDIGVSTHAHFDHDALHALSANVLLDRLVGRYCFADVSITGVADKHVSDSSHNAWDWADKTRRLTHMETRPPDNWRSFDNCMLLVEVAGLRILHWGDNRSDPPQHIWDMIGDIDVALLPIDGSQHVLSYEQADRVARRLKAKLIVPHHYYIWDVLTPGSTLLPPNEWVDTRPRSIWPDSGVFRLDAEFVRGHDGTALCFGEHVAFPKPDPKEIRRGA